MKVLSNFMGSLAACASAKSFSRGIRSILFSTRIFGCATVASFLRIASASSSMPALASSSTQTRSASWAPLQAVETMARSSLRFGEKMPGVSTRMIWALSSITMPRIRARVVCTLRETIVTLEPTSALTRVDLPTLGAPISATKPQAVSPDDAGGEDSTVIAAATDAFSFDHHGSRDLLGRALGAADAFGGHQPRQVDGDAELRVVMRASALDLAIDRRRQSLALGPFLQHRLGIAQRPARLAHPLQPVALDELRRRRISAVEIDRPDHGLADVAEDGFAQARAGAGADRAELDVVEQAERFCDVGAAFLAHEIGEAFRQFALVGSRIGPIQHVGDDQPEHVIAEKFETLIAVRSMTRGGLQGRDMGKGGRQHGGFGLLAWFARGRCVRDDRCFVVHRTIVKRRFQRTAVGQRQNIQACSPSAMEKKIICARPTMFSNGT